VDLPFMRKMLDIAAKGRFILIAAAGGI